MMKSQIALQEEGIVSQCYSHLNVLLVLVIAIPSYAVVREKGERGKEMFGSVALLFQLLLVSLFSFFLSFVVSISTFLVSFGIPDLCLILVQLLWKANSCQCSDVWLVLCCVLDRCCFVGCGSACKLGQLVGELQLLRAMPYLFLSLVLYSLDNKCFPRTARKSQGLWMGVFLTQLLV